MRAREIKVDFRETIPTTQIADRPHCILIRKLLYFCHKSKKNSLLSSEKGRSMNRWRNSRCLAGCFLFSLLCLSVHQSAANDNQGPSEEPLDDQSHLDSLSPFYPFNANDYKRLSTFYPLRGKKLSLDEPLYNYVPEDGNKRSQFYPLRGKKASDDASKRASNFMPMRGRKDDWVEDKRMSSFTPMRGKKWSEEDELFDQPGMYYDPGMSGSVHGYQNVGEKRRFAFVPTRGKKLEDSVENSTLEELSSLPFRGQKSEVQGPGEIVTSLIEKRQRLDQDDMDSDSNEPPSLAMNYSREDGSEIDSKETDWKRAANFMPMRGRKSSFPFDSVNGETNVYETRMPLIATRKRRSIEDLFSNPDTDFKRMSNFVPMRGRRLIPELSDEQSANSELDYLKRDSTFMPMRGRRKGNNYLYSPLPYFITSGIGSSQIARHVKDGSPVTSIRSAIFKDRKLDWDSVKRAFHATRGKRVFPGKKQEISVPEEESVTKESDCRCKRSLLRPQITLETNRRYLALKRPMSFFATRGKRRVEPAHAH